MSPDYTFSTLPQASEKNKRLIPNVLEDNARDSPDSLYAEIPVSSAGYDAGYRPITWAALSNAVDGIAWHLESHLGRSTSFETVAYMGPSDVRYVMVLIACIKVGYKVLLTSPRNSLAAHANLFDKLGCTTMITPSPLPPFVGPVLDARPDMKVVHIPAVDELLSQNFKIYPFEKTYESSRNDPIFCLHTSGSTGLPKPIVYSHEYVTRNANIGQLTPPDGYEVLNHKMANSRYVSLMPLFHIAGFYLGVLNPLFNGSTVILPSPAAPPTGSSLVSILEYTSADLAFVAPTHAEELGKNLILAEKVSAKIETILFSGGSVPKAAGDYLSTKLLLRGFLGSSEFGGYPHLLPKGVDTSTEWNTVELHPYANAHFEKLGNGYSELIIKKRDDLEPWQAIFTLFPDKIEYPTKDLFLPSPGRSNAWIHQGRDDDIIVFVTGEKTNPVTFEATVSKHQDVSAALVFGSQRYEAGILIEVAAEAYENYTQVGKTELIDRVWSSIEEANSVTPTHAQISRTHVILASAEKPMLRSAKGTVQRQLTIKLYKSEIDQLYASIDSGTTILNSSSRGGDASPSNEKLEETRSAIFETLKETNSKLNIAENDDFFSAGLDSLQALRLARQLKMKLNAPSINIGFIYANPSVKLLVSSLRGPSSGKEQSLGLDQSTNDNANHTFQKYKSYIDVLAECMNVDFDVKSVRNIRTRSPRVVLLTGSTGGIGSYLLKALIESPSVSHVFCLNRSKDSKSVQISRNRERDSSLPTVFSSEKVTFLQANLSDVSTLGLPIATYRSMLSSVSLIIHNAWPVDFIQTLASFNRQLAGICNLVLFAARAASKPATVFLSSISAVMNLKNSKVSVPEEPVAASNAAEGGYGVSKLLGEKLLRHASQRFNIDTAVVRVGQIAGARRSQGGWNTTEWFPRIIKSSKHIGALPESLGAFSDMIEWLPIDVLADVLVEIGLAVGHGPGEKDDHVGKHEIYHAVNPNRTKWSELRDSVMKTLLVDGPIKLVPTNEWLVKLHDSAVRPSSNGLPSGQAAQDDIETVDHFETAVVDNPALILEDFLTNALNSKIPLNMETEKTVQVSKSLKDSTPITGEEISRWTSQMIR